MTDRALNTDATPSEQREYLENQKRLREQGSTYKDHTNDLELGGRFAKQTPQIVVGSTPVPIRRAPHGALLIRAWSRH
jgi:hypothetical protein